MICDHCSKRGTDVRECVDPYLEELQGIIVMVNLCKTCEVSRRMLLVS